MSSNSSDYWHEKAVAKTAKLSGKHVDLAGYDGGRRHATSGATFTGRVMIVVSVDRSKKSGKNNHYLPELKCDFAGHLFLASMNHTRSLPYNCPECKKDVGAKNWLRFKATARRFGLTMDEYRKLREKHTKKRKVCCAICEKPENGRLHSVDHDHSTGVVRGLLCIKCNTEVGVMENVTKQHFKYLGWK